MMLRIIIIIEEKKFNCNSVYSNLLLRSFVFVYLAFHFQMMLFNVVMNKRIYHLKQLLISSIFLLLAIPAH